VSFLRKADNDKWVGGTFPAPAWIHEQTDFFIWTDLSGTSWFQSTHEEKPMAVCVPIGEMVERTPSGDWLFDGRLVNLG
jgi:hypothetical protein